MIPCCQPFTDVSDLLECLPQDEKIRTLVRKLPNIPPLEMDDDLLYQVVANTVDISSPNVLDNTLSFLILLLVEDGIGIKDIIDYGGTLPHSKRIIDAILRGGRTFSRTMSSRTIPPDYSVPFFICVEPGHTPREATAIEINTHPVIYVSRPNTRTRKSEPLRQNKIIMSIHVHRHIGILQRHFGRQLFDIFARGQHVQVGGYGVNLSQLTIWIWMRRFAIGEYVRSMYLNCVQSSQKIRNKSPVMVRPVLSLPKFPGHV